MAMSLSSLLLGGLALSSVVTAFPQLHPQILKVRTEVLETDLNFVEPTYAPPPPNEGPWIACEFWDNDCGCTMANGVLEHYCGWIDPSWISPLKGHWGRILSETEVGADTDETVDAQIDDSTAPSPADQDSASNGVFPTDYFTNVTTTDPATGSGSFTKRALEKRAKNVPVSTGGPEINQIVRNPLLVALKLTGFAIGKLGNFVAIRTRLPAAERGAFVQGISATLTAPLTVIDNGVQLAFKVGAKMTIRWDMSGLGANGQPPGNGMTGMHVNVELQDATTAQKWGYYAATTSYWPSWTDETNYYANILNRLNSIAGYSFDAASSTATWAKTEAGGAMAIAQLWDGFTHDEL